jgi:hypothetical protein
MPFYYNQYKVQMDEPNKKSGLVFAGSLIAGVLTGIALRLVFSSDIGRQWSAMSWQFIYLVPLAVSAVTLYVGRNTQNRSWLNYFAVGALSNGLFVIGTLVILIEGLICAIIIVPLFMITGGLSGLIVGAIFKWTKWPKSSINSFVALPVVLAILVPTTERTPVIDEIERKITINAPAEEIWPVLMNADNIQSKEIGHGWIYRIGVPLPQEGITKQIGTELVREVKMGKAVHFELRSTEWQKNKFVKWNYRFSDDSFPPHALDDHVKIGGHYFDVLNTTYTLNRMNAKQTELAIKIRYRVSTDFDWYANSVAQLLLGNFGSVVLDFYQSRAQP